MQDQIFNEQQLWTELPQWQQLQLWWQQQAEPQLLQMYTELQHQLRENGATFDPWLEQQRQLDLMPWLISDAEWQQIQAGIKQRQLLLALVLQDLYGPQLLLQQGLLPSELIFQNKNYLLPCHQLVPNHQQWLSLLAVDIGRDSKGQFCVYADQSQMPAGLGFVLEHRLAFNHCIGELNHSIGKSQLAGFFRKLQLVFAQGTGHTAEGRRPLCGLLTHGKRDAAYFEHAFLANYLDIALMHSADLMFKDGALWLKTVTGLQQVDSLMRYLPDARCDALELDPDSTGTAGLLQSIRQQQLLCANPPGAALLDSGVLLPFLPQLCRALLQEELQLPSTAAVWCGDPEGLLQVSSDAKAFRLRRVDTGESWLWAQLDPIQQHQLQQQLLADPGLYIAIPLLPLSTVPCWNATQGEHQQYGVLRLFGLLSEQHSPAVMPGALARISPDPLSLQHHYTMGFVAKDVWVLADQDHAVSLLQNTQKRILLSRHSGLLPSRVADHLFWLGRYNERLNLVCRALRYTVPLLTSAGVSSLQASASQHHDSRALVRFCLQANGTLPDSATLSSLQQTSALQQSLSELFSLQHPAGLAQVLKNLLFNAQSVREYFSEDTWYVLDKLQLALTQWPHPLNWQQPQQMVRLLDEVILLQTAIYGLNNETMSRTQTLRFMDLGQHLERALQSVTLLQEVFVFEQGHSCSASLMESVLRMTDTLMTYRRRYKTELHPLAVIDLLLLDDSTPRSVGYQCARLASQIQQLPKPGAAAVLSREQKLAVELVSLLQLAEPEHLFDDQLMATPELSRLLQQLHTVLRQLSDSITLSYFSHAEAGTSWQSF
ncbi:circularly permuted type 2 ATP-grasp protein [Rheinheimera sp.]|uniref:circularly permuted type 2 ATP-grasp protein n=1 Tax=Rheinheimera sp. TaxID=1869214 RepID=UPI00262568B3|nr:circularly permuted type 2 ATP-grasp protein [Rheinheimera sp.]MCA1931008.1 circularly permuted type 2 ATP-grasp protein [Rheinheimera sp.]